MEKEASAVKSLQRNNITNRLFSNFSFEDLLLFFILFILIEEGIDDDFLILTIIFLILTKNN